MRAEQSETLGSHPQGNAGNHEQSGRTKLSFQSITHDPGCNYLTRLPAVRRARAIGLGRWLLLAGDKPIHFSTIQRECTADARSYRRAGQATRAETITALNDLADAGGVSVDAYFTVADIEIKVLPPLREMVAAQMGNGAL